MDRPCRTTPHCLSHGFCHRCDQNLTDASKLIVQAIPAAGIPDEKAGAVYGVLMSVLAQHAPKASAIYDKRLNERMSGKVIRRLRAALQGGGVLPHHRIEPVDDLYRLVYIGGCTCAPGPEGQHEVHCGYVPNDSPLCQSGAHSTLDPCPGGCNEPVEDEHSYTCDLGYPGCVGRHDNHTVSTEDECALPYLMDCDCNHITGCQNPLKKREGK